MPAPDDHIEKLEKIGKVIRARRSIRKFKPDEVPPGWVESLISCAAMAPSPSNSQPVRFFRISSPAIREELHQCMIDSRDIFLRKLEAEGGSKKTKNLINAYFRYSEFMFNAPVLLCVGTEAGADGLWQKLSGANVLSEEASRCESELDITVGLSVMCLLLKSEALGLGSCILTAPFVFLSNLDERFGQAGRRIKCFVALGFPDESPAPPARKGISEIYEEI